MASAVPAGAQPSARASTPARIVLVGDSTVTDDSGWGLGFKQMVGSGVTGAEFASAYLALGIPVTLVSSRDRVLPGEDADASAVLEEVLTRRGMTVLSRSRMESVTRDGDVVTVALTDGRTVQGSHCILALGSVPNTAGIGLEEAGIEVDPARLRPLGSAFYTLPGIVSEKIHLLEAEVARGGVHGEHDAPLEGDGSPLEEGATLLWRPIDEAVAACEASPAGMRSRSCTRSA